MYKFGIIIKKSELSAKTLDIMKCKEIELIDESHVNNQESEIQRFDFKDTISNSH